MIFSRRQVSGSTSLHSRRIRATSLVAGLAALTSLVSACSSVNNDAITVNGTSLSRSDFDEILSGYADGVSGSRAENGTISAATARGLLTDWATTQIYVSRLRDDGVTIGEDQYAAAREGLARQTGFAQSGRATQEFYVFAAAVRSTFEAEYGLTDDQVRALYDQGPQTSKVYCMRGILTADEPSMGVAAERLANGEDFATVASEVSTDPTKASGGILQNPRTGGACLDEETLLGQVAPQFPDALAKVGIDEPTQPFEIPGVGWVILLLRPYDEVADDVRATVAQPDLGALRAELFESADVSVGSQYGRWDPQRGEVTQR